MDTIFLIKEEMPAEWLTEIENSLGEDIMFSPRGEIGESGEIIPGTLYSLTSSEYREYVSSGGVWTYVRPEEIN